MTYAPIPPPQPVHKSKAGLIIGIILGVLLLACVGCGAAVLGLGWLADKKANEIIDQLPSGEARPPAGQAGSHVVRYEVDGTGKAYIAWALGKGSQDSETAQLPWNKEITVDEDNFGLLVTAIPDADADTVKSCRILVDGKEQRKNDAKGGLLASCAFTYVGKP